MAFIGTETISISKRFTYRTVSNPSWKHRVIESTLSTVHEPYRKPKSISWGIPRRIRSPGLAWMNGPHNLWRPTMHLSLPRYSRRQSTNLCNTVYGAYGVRKPYMFFELLPRIMMAFPVDWCRARGDWKINITQLLCTERTNTHQQDGLPEAPVDERQGFSSHRIFQALLCVIYASMCSTWK